MSYTCKTFCRNNWFFCEGWKVDFCLVLMLLLLHSVASQIVFCVIFIGNYFIFVGLIMPQSEPDPSDYIPHQSTRCPQPVLPSAITSPEPPHPSPYLCLIPLVSHWFHEPAQVPIHIVRAHQAPLCSSHQIWHQTPTQTLNPARQNYVYLHLTCNKAWSHWCLHLSTSHSAPNTLHSYSHILFHTSWWEIQYNLLLDNQHLELHFLSN